MSKWEQEMPHQYRANFGLMNMDAVDLEMQRRQVGNVFNVMIEGLIKQQELKKAQASK